MRVGYARVSSTDQNLIRQVKALQEAKCDKIFREKQSGRTTKNRPQFKAAINFVHQGDTFVVSSLDRLSRNYEDSGKIIQNLRSKQVAIEILDAPFLSIKTGDAGMDNFMFDVLTKLLAYMAQAERQKIKDRQRQGIEIAQSQGKYKGKRLVYSDNSADPQKRFIYHRIVERLQEKSNGSKISFREIATETGVAVQTVINIKDRISD